LVAAIFSANSLGHHLGAGAGVFRQKSMMNSSPVGATRRSDSDREELGDADEHLVATG